MTTSTLTPYLLDPSLLDYTTALTRAALGAREPGIAEQTKNRALAALHFFIDLLDPSVPADKLQLEIFQRSRAAVVDGQTVAMRGPGRVPTSNPAPQHFCDLHRTATQHALSLPDILDVIFSNAPASSKDRRALLQAATLTSRNFHRASVLKLWSTPPDLDTVERQIRFAFSAAISSALSESLGNHVKRLRLRLTKQGWNGRLIETIAAACPGTEDLTLHWGDTADGTDPVTLAAISTFRKVLSSLPNLKHLYLCKFSSTPLQEAGARLATDARVTDTFSRLESLKLYGFDWYWPQIAQGLSTSLKLFDIGFFTDFSEPRLDELAEQLTALRTLRLSGSLKLKYVLPFLSHAPGLERVQLTTFYDEKHFTTFLVKAITRLPKLVEFSYNSALLLAQVAELAASSCALEDIDILLPGQSSNEGLSSSSAEYEDLIVSLINSKRRTLKTIGVRFEGPCLFGPSDALVIALASCPDLCRIMIDFGPWNPSFEPNKLSSVSVDLLLTQCPKLQLSSSLETLVAKNEFYNIHYKNKLEKEREEHIREMEEDVLGN